MLAIGERINASRKSIGEAIALRNAEFIRNEARAQAAAGADYLDVNAGTSDCREAEDLKWLVEVIQRATDTPLCIDSPDPAAIRAVLPLVEKTPIINSITLEPARLEGILPLVAQYKAKVIALCQSLDAIAETTEAKVQMAAELAAKTKEAGVPIGDLYIDPLVYPVATNKLSAMATLAAIEEIMARLPGVHTTCGLTNVSFGLPKRKLVNRAFLVVAVARGLDSAILDPTDNELFGTLKAALLISGHDDYCMEFIKAFREGRLG